MATLRQLNGFESRKDGALHAYLRQAVNNRVRDEIRRVGLEHALNTRSVLHMVGTDIVSRSALIRRFTRKFGLSPSRYLRNLRCVSAKALMREGLTVAQVAQELGFSDQAHFTREFKKIHGITPGRYRQAGCATVHESG